MRILVASFSLLVACGSSPKKESSIVEGSDAPPTCCCKTIPQVAEKDIVPKYANSGRMECSPSTGACVDDVQCNGQPPADMPASKPATTSDGVPPPPTLGGDKSAPAVP